MATEAAILTLRDTLAAIADRRVADPDDLVLVGQDLALVRKGGGAETAKALLDVAVILGTSGDPDGLIADTATGVATGSADADGFAALLGLTIAAYAFVRADYPAAQDAAAGRSALLARAEGAYAAIGPVAGDIGLAFAVDLVGSAAIAISRTAADRAPLVRVETGISLPSTLLAWQLYQDVDRAAELVTRNGSATPAVMPSVLEALAPTGSS